MFSSRTGAASCGPLSCSLLALAALVLLFLWTWTPEKTQYVSVIDCGSSGTRIYVFTWKYVKSRQGLPQLELIPPSAAQQLVPKKTGTSSYNRVETLPGLDAFADRPSQDLEALALGPLLDWARAVIPARQLSAVPIFLFATAGVRRMPEHKQRLLMDRTRLLMAASGFRFEPSWARIISGTDEGVYGWIAINYLRGHLDAAAGHAAVEAVETVQRRARADDAAAASVTAAILGRRGSAGAGGEEGGGAANGGQGALGAHGVGMDHPSGSQAVPAVNRGDLGQVATVGSLDLGGSSLEMVYCSEAVPRAEGLAMHAVHKEHHVLAAAGSHHELVAAHGDQSHHIHHIQKQYHDPHPHQGHLQHQQHRHRLRQHPTLQSGTGMLRHLLLQEETQLSLEGGTHAAGLLNPDEIDVAGEGAEDRQGLGVVQRRLGERGALGHPLPGRGLLLGPRYYQLRTHTFQTYGLNDAFDRSVNLLLKASLDSPPHAALPPPPPPPAVLPAQPLNQQQQRSQKGDSLGGAQGVDLRPQRPALVRHEDPQQEQQPASSPSPSPGTLGEGQGGAGPAVASAAAANGYSVTPVKGYQAAAQGNGGGPGGGGSGGSANMTSAAVVQDRHEQAQQHEVVRGGGATRNVSSSQGPATANRNTTVVAGGGAASGQAPALASTSRAGEATVGNQTAKVNSGSNNAVTPAVHTTHTQARNVSDSAVGDGGGSVAATVATSLVSNDTANGGTGDGDAGGGAAAKLRSQAAILEQQKRDSERIIQLVKEQLAAAQEHEDGGGGGGGGSAAAGQGAAGGRISGAVAGSERGGTAVDSAAATDTERAGGGGGGTSLSGGTAHGVSADGKERVRSSARAGDVLETESSDIWGSSGGQVGAAGAVKRLLGSGRADTAADLHRRRLLVQDPAAAEGLVVGGMEGVQEGSDGEQHVRGTHTGPSSVLGLNSEPRGLQEGGDSGILHRAARGLAEVATESTAAGATAATTVVTAGGAGAAAGEQQEAPSGRKASSDEALAAAAGLAAAAAAAAAAAHTAAGGSGGGVLVVGRDDEDVNSRSAGHVVLRHPCMHSGFSRSYTRVHRHNLMPHVATLQLVGSPDWAACLALVARTVNASASCGGTEHCLLGSAQPELKGRFVALAGFYVVWRFFGLGGDATPGAVLSAAQAHCGLAWSEVQSSMGQHINVEKYCLWGPYVAHLLTAGLGLGSHQFSIASGEVGWPIGAALAEALQLPGMGPYTPLLTRLTPRLILAGWRSRADSHDADRKAERVGLTAKGDSDSEIWPAGVGLGVSLSLMWTAFLLLFMAWCGVYMAARTWWRPGAGSSGRGVQALPSPLWLRARQAPQRRSWLV